MRAVITEAAAILDTRKTERLSAQNNPAVTSLTDADENAARKPSTTREETAVKPDEHTEQNSDISEELTPKEEEEEAEKENTDEQTEDAGREQVERQDDDLGVAGQSLVAKENGDTEIRHEEPAVQGKYSYNSKHIQCLTAAKVPKN